MKEEDDSWRVWDRRAAYGALLRRRASGELPEMESAISAADYVSPLIRAADHLLDVGAGVGHYFRSLRSRSRQPFTYTGVDATRRYLVLGADVWRGESNVRFVAGDIFRLPFTDRSADLVLCCNVLLHLPSVAGPLRELARVARHHLIVRTLVGERGFRVKEIEGDDIADDGEPASYNWYNIYPRAYIEHTLRSITRVRAVRIVEDRSFAAERIEQAARDSGAPNATRMVGDWQVNGYVLQPWCFVHVELDPR